MKNKLIPATIIALAAANAQAIPVDLSGWIAQGGSSSWNVQAGNDSVLQTTNGDPTVFFDPTATSTHDKALSGTIKVGADGDDDFVGFVLGYDSGEISGAPTDYFLVDWKQGNQTTGGTFGKAGIAVSHVTDSTTWWNDFWGHIGGVNEIQRGSTLGSTGWVDNVEYTFDIVFSSSLISVKVNGATELAITPGDVAGVSSFSDGSFGFYNMSQSQVLYGAIQQVDCSVTPNAPECQVDPVPAPATLALLGLGLGFMGWSRRKRA